MELPRIVAVGSGVILELSEICRQLQLKGRALIITGPRTLDVMGKAIFELLEEGGYEPETLICSASKLEEVDRAERLAREMGAGFLIGAGGGRSIDIAKLASLGVCVPFLSVPTAASHDGICSSQASLTVNGETTSIKAQSPLAIVADSKIISQAPARLLAAGCGDIISNYTAILDWQLAHRLRNEEYSEYAAALSGMTARMIVELAADIRPGRGGIGPDSNQSPDIQRSGHEHSRIVAPSQRLGAQVRSCHEQNCSGKGSAWRALRSGHHYDDVFAWRGLEDDKKGFGTGRRSHLRRRSGFGCR